jgi:hypothetical protein
LSSTVQNTDASRSSADQGGQISEEQWKTDPSINADIGTEGPDDEAPAESPLAISPRDMSAAARLPINNPCMFLRDLGNGLLKSGTTTEKTFGV